MADRKNGKNKLIDAHAFCTQSLCQEYLIEEAQESGDQAGSRKDHRTFQ
jgi:hypothetical protein